VGACHEEGESCVPSSDDAGHVAISHHHHSLARESDRCATDVLIPGAEGIRLDCSEPVVAA
jgi:hypothetical protein